MRARSSCMVDGLGGHICLAGSLLGGKTPKANMLSGVVDACPPFPTLAAYPEVFGRRVFMPGAHVLAVFRHGNVAEVFDSVVPLGSVDMVNDSKRPGAVGVQPRKSVREVVIPDDANINVPGRLNGPCDIASAGRRAGADAPYKNASFWVVVKQLAQTLCGKIGLSHDTVPSLIGQRPARVISTGGLRYFITHACSGAMGITKCLHQAALAAASVCMPANHRRLSNPLGALTPFNAL